MPWRQESCFPAPGKSHTHALSKKMRKFSRRRGKLCPGAGKKSHSFTVEEKCVDFPGAGGSCVPAPESSGARFWKGSGARLQRECRFSRRRGELSPGAEKAVSRRRVSIEEKCVGFPGVGGSCAPAPGKLFPGAGKGKNVGFAGAGGSCVPAPGNCFPAPRKVDFQRRGKLTLMQCRREVLGFPGAGGSCVPSPGKLFPGAGKAISRRPGKFTFVHYRRKMCKISRCRETCLPIYYRRKMCKFSRCRGKLCPGAGKAISRRRGKVTFIIIEEKCVGFPSAGRSCVPAPGKLFPGAGEKSSPCSVEEKCVGFPGAGGSCVLCPGKKKMSVFPAPGEAVSHRRESCFLAPGEAVSRRRGKLTFIQYRKQMLGFPGAGGSCVPAPGKLFPGAVESCVPASGLAGRRLV